MTTDKEKTIERLNRLRLYAEQAIEAINSNNLISTSESFTPKNLMILGDFIIIDNSRYEYL